MSNPLALLERACLIAGLDAEGARLLRIGSNTVYRLTAPTVVRISRPGADVVHARRTVAVARWLESVNYPAVRVLDVDQPVVLDGDVITFWEAVSDDGDEYATVGEAEVNEQVDTDTALEKVPSLGLPYRNEEQWDAQYSVVLPYIDGAISSES